MDMSLETQQSSCEDDNPQSLDIGMRGEGGRRRRREAGRERGRERGGRKGGRRALKEEGSVVMTAYTVLCTCTIRYMYIPLSVSFSSLTPSPSLPPLHPSFLPPILPPFLPLSLPSLPPSQMVVSTTAALA